MMEKHSMLLQKCRTYGPIFAIANIAIFTLVSYLFSYEVQEQSLALDTSSATAIILEQLPILQPPAFETSSGKASFIPSSVAGQKQSFVGVFALNKPSLDPDWKTTTIFGGDSRFVTLGVTGDNFSSGANFFAHSLNLLNSNDYNVDPLLTVAVCYRPSPSGLSSSRCRIVSNFSSSFISSDETLFANETSHFYFNYSSHSVLISRIYPISSSDYFCYGLPETNISVPFAWTNSCPPCLCAAVFSGTTLNQELSLISSPLPTAAPDEDNVVHLPPLSKLDAELRKANRLLKHSRLKTCLKKPKEKIEKPTDVFLVGDTPSLGAPNSWAVHELFRRNNMPLTLEGGTLLGWYRNCSIVWDDVDVDFSVPSYAIDDLFYKNLIHNAYDERKPLKESFQYQNSTNLVSLKSTRIFGDLTYGVEVRFDSWIEKGAASGTAVGIDVFVLYLGDAMRDYSYVQGFVTWERTIMQYALPKNLTLCSTVFLGDIYLVPCEPEPYLESHYGKGWSQPAQREDSYWRSQPNIIKRIKLTPKEWRERVMFKSFETGRRR